MPKSSDDAKRDAVLKRMLETPHKPHAPLGRDIGAKGKLKVNKRFGQMNGAKAKKSIE